jgi:hypothetical protein
MRKIKKIQTESTFSSNEVVKTNAGLSNIKRDGQIKDPSVSLYDIDYAIKWHFENVIQPTITENELNLTVPIYIAAGEKWSNIQRYGFMRDNQGKVLTPVIALKRNSFSKRDDVSDVKVLETADSRILVERKYTAQNRYDRFSITNKPAEREYYSLDIPKFVQVEYDLICWTNNISQMNEIVEQIIWFDGKAFGDTFKFITYIESPTFDTSNNVGEDRIVKATMSVRVKAHLLSTKGPNATSMYKLNPINKVVVSIETTGTLEELFSSNIRQNTIQTKTPTGGNTKSPSINAALTYINANSQLTGTVTSSTTITFPAGWKSAPAPLPATSVNNFMFYVNGVLIESTAISSFETSNGTSLLSIDVSQLGFSLDSSDEVVGIGKWS